ncbi:MAG: chromate efflux transporter [Acidimicrobiales bacterium]
MSEDGSVPRAGDVIPLATIAREWTKLGCISFGGPPTHIFLLRRLCVEQHQWLEPEEFEDAIAATNLLPGPASTQLAIFCAWKLRGARGAIIGGLGFIFPGLLLIIALSVVFLAKHPPIGIIGAAAGAGAVVPAVALNASWGLVPASWKRIGDEGKQRRRWVTYGVVGGVCAALIGEYLVLALIACGIVEIVIRRHRQLDAKGSSRSILLGAVHTTAIGGLAALSWEALKVGALSYGGGFVIIPLMQHDVVSTYHWMSGPQFLNAVALGQVTPGPVVQTVAVVGYAAAGIGGAFLAAALAFAPSFAFVIAGGSKFNTIRSNDAVQSFFTGAGPAVIGAIAGSAIPLGLSLHQYWQIPVLAGALAWLLVFRRNVVGCLLCAGVLGAVLGLVGVHV